MGSAAAQRITPRSTDETALFYTPVIMLPLGDGTYRVAQGKPVERFTMEPASQDDRPFTSRDLSNSLKRGCSTPSGPARAAGDSW